MIENDLPRPGGEEGGEAKRKEQWKLINLKQRYKVIHAQYGFTFRVFAMMSAIATAVSEKNGSFLEFKSWNTNILHV